MSGESPRDEILARMYVMMTLLALFPVAVAVQVVRVGLVDRAELRAMGEVQASSQVVLPARRGTVVDRAGRTLAVNTVAYDVAVDPTLEDYSAQSGELYSLLERLTGTSASEYARRVRQRSSPQYALLARGLSEPDRVALEDLGVSGLRIDARVGRRYTYGSLAAHILGHVDTDIRGRAGIEALFEEELSGEDGHRPAQRDRRGYRKVSAAGKVVEPQHGETIVLTIDLVRQTVMEEALARGVQASGAKWGTAIAMDPRNGAILAIANVPTYDPNRPGDYSSAARRNHAVTDRLEPGSTFKLATAIAAIETGTVTLRDTVDTGPGWIVLHGRTLRDTHAHGSIPFQEVISQSSNIGVALVAERLPEGALYQISRRLGFGMPTWVDMPGEVAGTLKPPSEWSRSTRSAMSRGYEVEATPLQILAAYASLANGGLLVKPHIVSERRDVLGNTIWKAPTDSVRRAFDQKTAEILRPAFEEAIISGTGKRARVPGLRVAGKTGTAWKTRNGSYEPGAYRASFVGFFPVEAPSVVMLVLMDEPSSSIYGGSVAAPVFQEIASRWMPTLDNLPSVTDSTTNRPSMPSFAGRPAALAAREVRAYGMEPRLSANDPMAVVVSQRPGIDSPIEPGMRTRLQLSDTTAASLPENGISTRDAVFWEAAQGRMPRRTSAGVRTTSGGGP